jgi:hypothetical protein
MHPAGQSPWLVEVPCSVKAERCECTADQASVGRGRDNNAALPRHPNRFTDVRRMLDRGHDAVLHGSCASVSRLEASQPRVPTRRLMRDRA